MKKFNSGQALISLLFFVIIAVTLTSGAVLIMLANAISQTKLQESSLAYEIAESGIENAELRLLRNPNYSGETLSVNGGNALVQVTNNSGIYTILSKGQTSNFIRQIQVTGSYANNVFAVTAQKEIF